MRFTSYRMLFPLLAGSLFGCSSGVPGWKNRVSDPALVHRCEHQLTAVVVHDVFSPPVASRVYVYPNIAMYEAMVPARTGLTTLAGKLNGLDSLPAPAHGQETCFEIAAVKAFVATAKQVVFSEDLMDNFLDSLVRFYRSAGVPDAVLDRSMEYGQTVADHIGRWAAADLYKESRSFERYTPLPDDSAWIPTPPDYADALEPHWNRIRPLVMDSASQFMPPRPFPFSTDTASDFYRMVMDVYNTINNGTVEQEHIAKFWDNNPYIKEPHGHLMVGVKKVSPPGHWLGIAAMACRTRNAGYTGSIETYTYTSIAFFDAFISAFDEKYRSHYIRPETYLNRYVDPAWKPVIQTPPFPEYTSAHSVTSGAAATILTRLYGEGFAFVDSVEVPFGQKPRKQPGFLEAAQEASISRLYGGIHYRISLDNGNLQGRTLGAYIVGKLDIRPLTPPSATP